MDPPEQHSGTSSGTSSGTPHGTLIVRAWLEDGRPDRLRVRILSTVGGQPAPPLAASSVEAVQTAVREFLTRLANIAEDSR
ncbi:hypothetical protein BLA60_17305 [Actinophytocola xinjiangensis]|uniref:Uncharacterized protein n=1 Tax=Actinophytocola xinjiangensis TaxID=485602 RepID=A0A7Z0WMK1_9PSEU|nr:hypothetical protein BLA60_17305 [Actinophytocola xinjiangensis]